MKKINKYYEPDNSKKRSYIDEQCLLYQWTVCYSINNFDGDNKCVHRTHEHLRITITGGNWHNKRFRCHKHGRILICLTERDRRRQSGFVTSFLLCKLCKLRANFDKLLNFLSSDGHIKDKNVKALVKTIKGRPDLPESKYLKFCFNFTIWW